MLRLDIDRNLIFNEHVSSVCRKAGNKLSVLARLLNFMSFKQRRILLKTFVESQFKYCLLIWMFHSRRVNNKFNHTRSRRIVYKDNCNSYVDLLANERSFTIRQRNIQSLAMELFKAKLLYREPYIISLFKVKRNLSNAIMCSILKTRTMIYNLVSQTYFLKDILEST